VSDQTSYRSSKTLYCEDHDDGCLRGLIKDVDYVTCGLCGLIGTKISKHLTEVHAFDSETHQALYGPVTAAEAIKRHSEIGKINGDWISRRKAAGDDLAEYRTKMGQAVSNAIMNNLVERARRSALAKTTITAWAQSEDGRKSSSNTAKVTSARPEILDQRTENLRAWREREPEKFQATVTKFVGYKTTKPERTMLRFVQEAFPKYGFKGNQQLRSNERFLINKSRIRQIDVLSRTHKVIIEVDGWLHFNEVKGWSKLALIQAKDHELNVSVPEMGYLLVRVAYDQWNNAGELSDACKWLIAQALRVPAPGVLKIGGLYETKEAT
jgi:very-short-patch-repair endonuclease